MFARRSRVFGSGRLEGQPLRNVTSFHEITVVVVRPSRRWHRQCFTSVRSAKLALQEMNEKVKMSNLIAGLGPGARPTGARNI